MSHVAPTRLGCGQVVGGSGIDGGSSSFPRRDSRAIGVGALLPGDPGHGRGGGRGVCACASVSVCAGETGMWVQAEIIGACRVHSSRRCATSQIMHMRE